jgi:hypothetical protein
VELNMADQSLAFSDFTFISVPSGAYLIFPKLTGKKPRRQEEIAAVTGLVIDVRDEQDDFVGYGHVAAGTLHISLQQDDFRQLRRQLKAVEGSPALPLVFDYSVTDDRVTEFSGPGGASGTDVRELHPGQGRKVAALGKP